MRMSTGEGCKASSHTRALAVRPIATGETERPASGEPDNAARNAEDRTARQTDSLKLLATDGRAVALEGEGQVAGQGLEQAAGAVGVPVAAAELVAGEAVLGLAHEALPARRKDC